MDRFAMRGMSWIACVPISFLAHEARAHGPNPIGVDAHWQPDPMMAILLAAGGILYAAGAGGLWHKAGLGRGITIGQAGWFACGWLALVVALLSPLEHWGERLLWAHMLQHELLMVVAAPLLVLGRPLEACAWGLPMRWRRGFGVVVRNRRWRDLWLLFTAPLAAWIIHSAVIWVWHAPSLFQAALSSDSLHTVQHTSFLVGALVFWSAALGHVAHRPRPGVSVFLLFSTMLHTGALGALLTFSPTLWYPAYAATQSNALSHIEDQQLAGLIMWVPAGLAYMAAALALAARVLLPARDAVLARAHRLT